MKNKYLPEESLKDRNIVTQSINLVESSYKLKTIEQKMFLTLISQIQPTDQDFISYYFKVKDFSDFLNVSSNNMYKELLNNTENIMKKVIRIKNKITGDVILTHWVQKAIYHKKKGMLEVQFDPGLKPYLLNLKNQFVSYPIKNIKNLKSFYTIRIYELLKQYQKIGKRGFEFNNLKEILGIEKDEYVLYGHFKNKVVQKAVDEINAKTDIVVSFEEKKEGKKVYYLLFYIKHNTSFIPQKSDNKEIQFQKGILDIFTFLTDTLSISLEDANSMIIEYGEEYLLKNANFLANHKKVIDKNMLKVDFFTLLKKPEINKETYFMDDQEYMCLEQEAKKQKDYETQKIFYMLKVVEEFEYIKNGQSTLEESLSRIRTDMK